MAKATLAEAACPLVRPPPLALSTLVALVEEVQNREIVAFAVFSDGVWLHAPSDEFHPLNDPMRLESEPRKVPKVWDE